MFVVRRSRLTALHHSLRPVGSSDGVFILLCAVLLALIDHNFMSTTNRYVSAYFSDPVSGPGSQLNYVWYVFTFVDLLIISTEVCS